MEKWYFLEASTTHSGLSKLASELVGYARKRYDRNIVNEWAIGLVVRQLEQKADELHKANPRCRKPEVKFDKLEHVTYDRIRIDEWSMLCKKATAIIQ